MKLVTGIVLGIALTVGASRFAQNDHPLHPRIAAAITALRDARAYMAEAPHDFGGHRDAAIRACDEALRQLNIAVAYHPKESKH
jgi:hypothetical protein